MYQVYFFTGTNYEPIKKVETKEEAMDLVFRMNQVGIKAKCYRLKEQCT